MTHISVDTQQTPFTAEDASIDIVRKALLSQGWLDVEHFDTGGTGIIFKATQPNTHRLVALKVIKPRLAERIIVDDDELGQKKTYADLITREIRALSSLSHPSLTEILAADTLPIDGLHIPYFAMPFYTPAWTLYEYITTRDWGEDPGNGFQRWFTSALLSLADTFVYIHGLPKPWYHRDVKGGNILVTDRGHVRLMDLGSAWPAGDALEGDTVTVQDQGYLHPKLMEYLRAYGRTTSDGRRTYLVAPRHLLAEYGARFDLYAFGVTIRNALEAFASKHGSHPVLLEHIGVRLRNAGVDDTRACTTAAQLLADLHRVDTERDIGILVPELGNNPGYPIQIAPPVGVPLSRPMRDIVDTWAFQRLRDVKQLGLTSYVYPSATHTRFEHSLGAYYWARQYLISLWSQPGSYLRSAARVEHLQATLIATLLHDVGQYPFAHAAEGAVRDVMAHETLGAALVQKDHPLRAFLDDEAKKRGDELVAAITNGFGSEVTTLAVSLLGNVSKPEVLPPELHSLLRSVLDGPIDVDKMDYIRRDSFFTGLGLALSGMEERFVPALRITGGRDALGIGAEGRDGAEQLMDQRYRLFKWVYWHRTVRSFEAVIIEVVRALYDRNTEPDTWRGQFLSKALRTGDSEMLDLLIEESKAAGLDSSFEEALSGFKMRVLFRRLVTIGMDNDGTHAAYVCDVDLYKALTRIGNADRDGIHRGRLKFKKDLAPLLKPLLGCDGLRELDFVVDIPIPGRHLVGNLKLIGQNGAESNMDPLSNVWKAYPEDFEEVVRRVRVFVSPRITAEPPAAEIVSALRAAVAQSS